MTQQGFLFNPFQAQAVMLKAMIDASKDAQEITIGALKRAGQRKSSPVEWVSFAMPIPDPRGFINEDVMRGTFHRMADQNLRGWEVAADLLKTMPSWVGMSAKVPGTVLTDWFDQMRRASESMMPANDSWATNDLALATPMRPRTAPKVTVTSKPMKTIADAAPAKIQTKPAARSVSAPAKSAPTRSAGSTKAASPKTASPKTAATRKTTRPAPSTRAPAKSTAKKADGPVRLKKPRGKADDLTAIKGIGEKLASLLNTIGIYHYDQIASWTAADSRWIDEKLAFKGRVSREKWVQQAKGLVKKAA